MKTDVVKAKIFETKVGVKTFYYPAIRRKFLFWSYWSDLGYVFLDSGSVSWYYNIRSYHDSLRALRNYETLFGLTLQIEGLKEEHDPYETYG